MTKKRVFWEVIVLTAAIAVTAVISSLVTSKAVKSRYEPAATTVPSIIESYEPTDPVKLDLGNLDDITSITVSLGNRTEVQVEGDRSRPYHRVC